MNILNEYIDSLVERVVAKTHNAFVDWNNTKHILALETILTEDGVPFYLINELVLDLQTEKKETKKDDKKVGTEFPAINVDSGNLVYYDSEETRKKAYDKNKARKLTSTELDKAKTTKTKSANDIANDSENKTTSDKSNKDNTNYKWKKRETPSDNNIEASSEEILSNKIVGKEKGLKQGGPTNDNAYDRDTNVNEEDFLKNMEKINVSVLPSEKRFKIDTNEFNALVPRKYRKFIERAMNTRKPKEGNIKASEMFDSDAGAGAIQSQLGEVLTMVGATMSKDEFTALARKMNEHVKTNFPNNKGVITSDWIESSVKSAETIRGLVEEEFGEGALIIAGAWDNEEDFNLIGGTNYKENKGYSTDVYYKVRTKNNEDKLFEVSLKKNLNNVYMLNSGFDKVFNEEPESSTNYKKKNGERLLNLIPNVKQYTDKGDEYMIKKLKISKIKLATLKSLLSKDRDSLSQDDYKVLNQIIYQINKVNKDETFSNYLTNDATEHKETQMALSKWAVETEEKRKKVEKIIQTNFPFNSIGTGEEVMVLGENKINRKTLKQIFGTSDFKELHKKLNVKLNDKGTPIITYKADANGKEIPIADVEIRQKPRGVGSFTFYVKLSPKIQKLIAKANKAK